MKTKQEKTREERPPGRPELERIREERRKLINDKKIIRK
jgi:hypothetical protein